MQDLITKLIQLRVEKDGLEKQIKEINEKLITLGFEREEVSGIVVKKIPKKFYKFVGDIEELEKKYPKFIEKKAKKLGDLYKIDPTNIERTVTETIMITGLPK